MNVIELLTFTVAITSGINGLFQYVILNSKIKNLEKEWPRIKSLLSLASFKKFLDVVSADEAQELLEELMIGLRTQPALDLTSSFVEEKLTSLKGNLKALLEMLNIADVVTTFYTRAKHYYSNGLILNVIALTSLILVFVQSLSLLFLGLSLGFEIDSLLSLFYSFRYIEKIEKVKNTLKKYVQS
ncbi:hypothetical protein [Stygiolobus azoricus]|uniref:DUF2721 domain-containing protein n=1 Tax=Stygiolobus azoricus TaxID=41675 RepID=A0A650CL22_9CREN|nr:hypothetical protein [Stygiolobus azoricus]QGR18550.1 hypothetical protein D1868_00090 [Stygiolobus azoricus]